MPGKGTPPLESKVVRELLAYLRSRGAFAEKVHGDALQPTLLDIIACYKGRFIHLEAKRASGIKPTPRQAYTIEKVKAASGIAGTVYSVEQVKQILDAIDVEDSSATIPD